MYRDATTFSLGATLGGGDSSATDSGGVSTLLDGGTDIGHSAKVNEDVRATSRGETATSEA